MRQAGIIAAGAFYALQNNRQRLAEDHANARKLADGLAQIPGVEIIGAPVQSNIVRFRTPKPNAKEIAAQLKNRGVLVFDTGPQAIRAVTHLQVSSANIETALAAFQQVMRV